LSPLASDVLPVYQELSGKLSGLSFDPPVVTVYNPLDYAWAPFEELHRRYLKTSPRILFLGMNPGPFGMVQTGIPFGDPEAVRDWLGISADIRPPEEVHPKRPVTGLSSERREVSGRRLWGLFAERFGTPERLFSEHYVANYCPLAFMAESGRNITPDKLSSEERRRLFAACDEALGEVIAILSPETVVGIGRFAEERLNAAIDGSGRVAQAPRVARILHPSPASPAANRGWAEQATRSLEEAGLW
jgi:single-strand selective monofunctional uracil DNA glycosylase